MDMYRTDKTDSVFVNPIYYHQSLIRHTFEVLKHGLFITVYLLSILPRTVYAFISLVVIQEFAKELPNTLEMGTIVSLLVIGNIFPGRKNTA